MMKKVFAATVVFVAFLVVGPLAYASCNNLIIEIRVPDWKIVTDEGEGACVHGQIQYESPERTSATLSNVGDFGPDCNLEISSEGRISTVRFQQNFCVLEAGSITVQHISGAKPLAEPHEGAYWGGHAGRVFIKGFE